MTGSLARMIDAAAFWIGGIHERAISVRSRLRLFKAAAACHARPMNALDSTVLLLLALLLGVVVLGAVGIFRALRLLHVIERRLFQIAETSAQSQAAADSPEGSARGVFEDFLDEDSTRRRLPKREQFEAYRRWRQEKGLNWSKP